MKKFFFIPLLLGFSIIPLSIFFGGFSFSIFLDSISFAIMVLMPTFLLLTHFSVKEIFASFQNVFKNTNVTEEKLRKSILFFKTLEKLIIVSGFISTFYGIIGMLCNLGNNEAIGKGLAASLLTIFYGAILICFITIPFKSSLEKKLCSKGL
ncbi:MAG: hypothetical protein A2086_06900 [Spirochaetes bacterium GWD1_27_9]|nr:MAG: hypothetical protein A2Z98_14845 [Spirochaetes bacterium GWB1_27_13]OHD26943.1 MAG: hypothetical protein A2Y34_18615 [Spirochaetes bacterium GWC1_27_15]OHD35692.1 MAG: hypothetical protein A2086_06900 [Spirochaetes bacterium GWD1_27_9]